MDVASLVRSGEPALAYQPLVDLGSGRLLGFEALLRWQHEEEFILPRVFIPWLEANGEIAKVGEWVLAEGCRQAADWPKNVQLAINCSLVQLQRGVELAVDDVGTSWTSFDVLRRMSINTIKIDRSFVSNLEPHQGINRMIV